MKIDLVFLIVLGIVIGYVFILYKVDTMANVANFEQICNNENKCIDKNRLVTMLIDGFNIQSVDGWNSGSWVNTRGNTSIGVSSQFKTIYKMYPPS